MREIKFRGKTKEGEWITGSLIQYENEYVEGGIAARIVTIEKPEQVTLTKKGYSEYPSAWVDPKSVSQFTGLKDKNGTEIYEGDVVLVKGIKKVGIYEDLVVWERFGFTLENNKTYLNNDRCLVAVNQVTGNIHDK